MSGDEKKTEDSARATSPGTTLPAPRDFGSARSTVPTRARSALETARVGDVLGGRYEILAELGRGAEGVVYRARDLSADALVALKLIGRESLTGERLARLRRELANARRVTHPNAVRIYHLVELPSGLGLSMELVDGETLAARLARSALDTPALERLARDLAASLAAAHAAGVVHRDLKPSNVLLRAGSGEAIVTDFGVSHLVAQELASDEAIEDAKANVSASTLTARGALIGTPAYMAPEQLDGRATSGPRADVFALGLLVHEAACGQAAHLGLDTLDALRAARRERLPSLALARPDASATLVATIDRCLDPEPAERFADGAAVLAALTTSSPPSVAASLETAPKIDATANTSAPATTRSSARALALGALAVALALGAATLGGLGKGLRSSGSDPTARSPSTRAPAVRSVRRVTFEPGCESAPSFTPDGKTLVFDSDEIVEKDGQHASDLFALDLATGAKARLTRAPDNDYGAKVSPDGRAIAYFHGDSPYRELRVIDARGDDAAPPRSLGDASAFAWTPEGALLVGTKDGSVARVALASAGAAREVVATLDGGRYATSLAAYDERAFALLWRRSQLKDPQLGEVDERVPRLVDDAIGSAMAEVVVGPSRARLYHTRRTAMGAFELVARARGGGAPEVVSSAVPARGGFSIARDGKRLAYSTCNGSSLLMRIDGAAPPADVGPLVDWDDANPRRIDARRVLVTSNRAGPEQLWVLDLTTGAARVVVDTPGRNGAPSRDAKQVVFVAPGAGLRVAPLDGGAARVLTEDPSDNRPAFDRTGATVVFERTTPEGRRVFAIPTSGGEARALTAPGTGWPAASPVDDRLVYATIEKNGAVRSIGLDGAGDRVFDPALPPGTYLSLRFSDDGARLLAVRPREIVESTGGASAPVLRATFGDESALMAADWAPDGRGFIAEVLRFAGDVWIAEGDFD